MSEATPNINEPKEENYLAKFGPTFQRQILSHLIFSPEFRKTTAPYLKPSMFTNKTLEAYARIILDFHHQFPDDVINNVILTEEFKRRRTELFTKPEEENLFTAEFVRVLSPPQSPAYIESQIIPFCAQKALERALAKASGELLEKGEREKIVELVTNAAMLTNKDDTVLKIEPVDVTSDMDAFIDRLGDPEDLGKKTGIPTGFAELDKLLMAGGVDLGEMIVVCGPPGRGKTPWLINCAAQATMRGYNALYYSLEVAEKIVRMRYISCLTGIEVVDLAIKAQEAKTRYGKVAAKHQFGRLFIYDYPSKALKPSMIRAHLWHYKAIGVPISAVFVDYADIMSSDQNVSIDNKRLEMGDVYVELRAIAKEFKVAMYTASAGNRGSLNHKEVDLDDLAEDFSKAFTADYVIGLNQAKQDLKIRPRGSNGFGTGMLRQFLAKNRNQKRGDTLIGWSDFTRMRVNAKDWVKHDHELFGVPLIHLPLDNPETLGQPSLVAATIHSAKAAV